MKRPEIGRSNPFQPENFRLGTSGWELRAENFRLRTSGRELQAENFRPGASGLDAGDEQPISQLAV